MNKFNSISSWFINIDITRSRSLLSYIVLIAVIVLASCSSDKRILELSLDSSGKPLPAEFSGVLLLQLEQGDGPRLGRMQVGDSILEGDGEMIVSDEMEQLVFAGSIPLEEPGTFQTISLIGSITSAGFQGYYLAGLGTEVWFGSLTGLFRRGALPGPRVPRDRDCGNLLWTDESNYGSGVGRMRIRIEKYERCVKYYFMDTTQTPPQPIQAFPGVVKPDATTVRGGVTVTAFNDAVINVTVKNTAQKHCGELKVFTIEGCTNSRVVQHVKETRSIIRPDGTVAGTNGHNWMQDGPDPFAGTIPNQNAAMDMPGVDPATAQNNPNYQALGDGYRIKVEQWFETFFYCDGNLIGWYSWKQEIQFPVKGGVVGKGIPYPSKPVWHDAGSAVSQSGGENL